MEKGESELKRFMDAGEMIKTAQRECQKAAGVGGEVRQAVAGGRPLTEMRRSVSYWRDHLTAALCSVTALEELAKGCPAPKRGD